MYYRVLPCITVVLHNVNTRASDTPQIRRDTTVIHVFRELSHVLEFVVVLGVVGRVSRGHTLPLT